MSDLDLLRGLGEQIMPPSFDTLRETARRRTRRTAALATAVVAVAATAIGAVQMVVPTSGTPPTGPTEVDGARPLTYAEGSTVHYGDQSVTMPGRVVELDLTDDGVAVRTADNRVWFTDGGAADEISEIGESGWGDDESHHGDFLWGSYVGRMVSGNSGSDVAWFEFPQPQSPVVVVYDTEAREVVYRDGDPIDLDYTDVASGLYSVDSKAVYGFTDLTYGEALRPLWRIDFETGAFESLSGDRPYQRVLESRGAARTLLVSHDEAPGLADYVRFDGLQQFSVHGTAIRPEGEQPLSVRDGLTGQDFRFTAPPGYPDTNPLWLVQWLDDDTVVLHAMQPGGVDLLECDVTTSECTIAVQASPDAVVPEIG
jgi:hypothetical protein